MVKNIIRTSAFLAAFVLASSVIAASREIDQPRGDGPLQRIVRLIRRFVPLDDIVIPKP